MMSDAVLQYVRRSVLSWLATIDENGFPNVSPKEIFCSSGDRLLLIANIASPGSMKNILARPRVCVSFVDVFSQKGFKVKGMATVARVGDAAFATFAPPLAELAGQRFPFSSIFVVNVQSVDPIIAPSYRLLPDTQESAQIASALRTYGVQPL